MLGAPSNLALVPMPALCPAGMHDRPPLDETRPAGMGRADLALGPRPLAVVLVVKFDVVAAVSIDFHPGHGHVVLTVLRFPLCTPHVPHQWIHRCCRRDVAVIGEDQSSMSE